MNRKDFYTELINKIAEKYDDDILGTVTESNSYIAFGTKRFRYEVRYNVPGKPFEISLAFEAENQNENKQHAKTAEMAFKKADLYLERKKTTSQNGIHLIFANDKLFGGLPEPFEAAEMICEAFAVTPQKILDWAFD